MSTPVPALGPVLIDDRPRLDRDPWAAAGLLQIGTVAPWASGSTAARARARGQHRVRPAPASPADRFGRMKSLLPVADRAVSSQPSWSRIWREGSQPGP